MAAAASRDKLVRAALDAWRALERASLRWAGPSRVVAERPGARDRASLWTLVHVLAAAVDLAALDHDPGVTRLTRLLRPYRGGPGYLPVPGARLRFYDDNAWLGLVSLRIGRSSDRRRAARALRFVRTGEHRDGGVRWREAHGDRNACSTAPAGELALALGSDPAFAARCAAWIGSTLGRRDGLIADRLGPDGAVGPTVWTYNQGSTVGLLRLLGDLEPSATHRTRARDLAFRSLEAFPLERVWSEPPPFLAIWFRELLALPEAAGPTRERLADHARRLLEEARDPTTGLFDRGGVGSYDGRGTIDQAAHVQLLALAAGAPPRPVG